MACSGIDDGEANLLGLAASLAACKAPRAVIDPHGGARRAENKVLHYLPHTPLGMHAAERRMPMHDIQHALAEQAENKGFIQLTQQSSIILT